MQYHLASLAAGAARLDDPTVHDLVGLDLVSTHYREQLERLPPSKRMQHRAGAPATTKDGPGKAQRNNGTDRSIPPDGGRGCDEIYSSMKPLQIRLRITLSPIQNQIHK